MNVEPSIEAEWGGKFRADKSEDFFTQRIVKLEFFFMAWGDSHYRGWLGKFMEDKGYQCLLVHGAWMLLPISEAAGEHEQEVGVAFMSCVQAFHKPSIGHCGEQNGY